MKKRQKNLIPAMAILLLAVVLSSFILVWGGFLTQKTETQPFTPHYMIFEGVQTRIYVVSETSIYSIASQTYVSSNGVTVSKGNGIFTINVTIRNDYSSDNPPPNTGTPVAPIDGTTYIQLQPFIFDNKGNLIPAVNISASDYPTTTGRTGLVLASGQTLNFQLVLATSQNTVESYTINLATIGDSISS